MPAETRFNQRALGDGSLLDRTVVLFGSGMGYGGSHSNRNLPIFVAGGGFSHRGHADATGRTVIPCPVQPIRHPPSAPRHRARQV